MRAIVWLSVVGRVALGWRVCPRMCFVDDQIKGSELVWRDSDGSSTTRAYGDHLFLEMNPNDALTGLASKYTPMRKFASPHCTAASGCEQKYASTPVDGSKDLYWFWIYVDDDDVWKFVSDDAPDRPLLTNPTTSMESQLSGNNEASTNWARADGVTGNLPHFEDITCNPTRIPASSAVTSWPSEDKIQYVLLERACRNISAGFLNVLTARQSEALQEYRTEQAKLTDVVEAATIIAAYSADVKALNKDEFTLFASNPCAKLHAGCTLANYTTAQAHAMYETSGATPLATDEIQALIQPSVWNKVDEPPPEPPSSDSDGLADWEIALIVVGALLGLAGITAGIVVAARRRTSSAFYSLL